MGMRTLTVEMLTHLHVLWDKEHLTASQCVPRMLAQYPLYPGSLSRSALLGAMNRARPHKAYEGWFALRLQRRGPPLGYRPGVPRNRRPGFGASPTRKNPFARVTAKKGKWTGQAVRASEEALLASKRRMEQAEVAFVAPPKDTPPVSFMDLTEKQCKWPVDGGHCGAERIEGKKPYCEKHARM